MEDRKFLSYFHTKKVWMIPWGNLNHTFKEWVFPMLIRLYNSK